MYKYKRYPLLASDEIPEPPVYAPEPPDFEEYHKAVTKFFISRCELTPPVDPVSLVPLPLENSRILIDIWKKQISYLRTIVTFEFIKNEIRQNMSNLLELEGKKLSLDELKEWFAKALENVRECEIQRARVYPSRT